MRYLKASLVAAMLLAVPGVAGAADITVQRGDAVSKVRVSGAGPTVLRGGGTMRVKPPKEVAAAPERSALAGRTLWLLADNRPVAACFLVNAGYVGKRKIRCTTARY
ncbi:MAG: hypothetical protein OXT01_00185 [Rhodospirillaceae bacterium]|nr:hypothetical protein [Rhodospirillaceae bacterium]